MHLSSQAMFWKFQLHRRVILIWQLGQKFDSGVAQKTFWPKGRSSKGRKSICCQNRVVRTNCRFHLKRDKFWSTSHQFNFWGPWVGSVNPPITTIRWLGLNWRPNFYLHFNYGHIYNRRKSFLWPQPKKNWSASKITSSSEKWSKRK